MGSAAALQHSLHVCEFSEGDYVLLASLQNTFQNAISRLSAHH